jgi:hypothetical protein
MSEQNQNDSRRQRLGAEAHRRLLENLASGLVIFDPDAGAYVPARPVVPDEPLAPGEAASRIEARPPVLIPLADGTRLDIALCDYDLQSGHFVRSPPPRRRRPPPPGEPPAPEDSSAVALAKVEPPPPADLSSDLSSVALAKEDATRAEEAPRPGESSVFWEVPGNAGSLAADTAGESGKGPQSLEQAFASALAAAAGSHAKPRELKPVAFLRNRPDGWNPERQRRFLEELAECGIVHEAATRVGMTRRSAFRLRHRAEGTAFAAAWEQAIRMGMKRIHSVAFERAVRGVPKPIFYHGKQVGEQRIYDHRLLIRLLGKAGDAWDYGLANSVGKRFDDWLEAVEHGWNSPQPRLEAALHDRVWQEEDGNWWTDFPRPDGAEVTESGDYGDEDYCRTLTEAELEAVEALNEREYDQECAQRDRLFGLEI